MWFQAKVVSDTDEHELAKQLERLEDANREVDGDDDADEYEELGMKASSDLEDGEEEKKPAEKAADEWWQLAKR